MTEKPKGTIIQADKIKYFENWMKHWQSRVNVLQPKFKESEAIIQPMINSGEIKKDDYDALSKIMKEIIDASAIQDETFAAIVTNIVYSYALESAKLKIDVIKRKIAMIQK